MAKKQKKYLVFLIGVAAIAVFLRVVTPFAFSEDGFITRMRVADFENQYRYRVEDISRHGGADMKYIYLCYIGFGSVYVKDDGTDEFPEVERVFPFLYRWKIDKAGNNGAYRVVLGKKKYYFTFLLN